jgi:uncharacterized protein (DUF58 family)
MPSRSEIRPLLRRLEIHARRSLAGLSGGDYRSLLRGQGLEFADLRPYQPGDDIRAIDWNVTARSGVPHIKQFEEERSRSLTLLADISLSMTPAKRHLLVETAALLAFATVQHRDRLGLIAFSDQVETLVRPKTGRAHALRILDELLTREPSGGNTDLHAPLEAALAVNKRPGILVLLSDGHIELPQQLIDKVRAKHDLLMLPLRDSHEQQLPKAGLTLFADAESGEQRLIDLSDSHATDNRTTDGWQRLDRTLSAKLRRRQIDHTFLRSEQPIFPALATLFRRRRRG